MPDIEIDKLIAAAQSECASLTEVDAGTPVNSYAALLHCAQSLALQDAIDAIKPISQATDLSQRKAQFASHVQEIRQLTQDTALCAITSPSAPSNRFYRQVFKSLYPNAEVVDFLKLFGPDVKELLLIEVGDTLEPQPAGEPVRPMRERVPLLCKTIPTNELTNAELLCADSEILVADGAALAAPSCLRGDYNIFSRVYKLLSERAPKLYEQLKSYNTTSRDIYTLTETLAGQRPTLREALKRWQNALIRSGTRMTGQVDADWLASDETAYFDYYLDSLPATRREQYLALSAGGMTLAKTLENLRLNQAQCVEQGATTIGALLASASHKAVLDGRIDLTDEEIKEARNTLNRLGRQEVKPRGEGAYYTALPKVYLDKAIERLKFADLTSLAECLSNFTSLEVYQAIYKRWEQAQEPPIARPIDLANIILFLNYEQLSLFLVAFNDRLLGVIKSGRYFGAALKFLTPEQSKLVIDAMKDKLPEIIKSGSEFGNALNSLTLEQGTLVFDAMKDKLPEIIKDGEDFGDALQYLSPEQRMLVFDAMKDNLPVIIKSGWDFGSVLLFLTPEQGTLVLESFRAMPEKIVLIIREYLSFGDFPHDLDDKQVRFYMDAFEVLPELSELYRGDANKNKSIAHKVAMLFPDNSPQRRPIYSSITSQIKKALTGDELTDASAEKIKGYLDNLNTSSITDNDRPLLVRLKVAQWMLEDEIALAKKPSPMQIKTPKGTR